jgi:alkaline phosphatase
MLKLQGAMASFKEQGVDGVIELGDAIDSANSHETDKQRKYVSEVFSELRSMGKPVWAVFGNHCLQVLSKKEFMASSGLKRPYYSFTRGRWHFVALDACYKKDGTPYERGNFEWTDCDIPQKELDWLKRDLAQFHSKKTVVFVHQRLDGAPGDAYSVHSSAAVREVLEKAGNVVAVFQGHDHKGDMKVIGGIKYVTLCGLIEDAYPENAYSVLELRKDGTWSLKGFGRNQSVN